MVRDAFPRGLVLTPLSLETKWGLGLENIADLPAENIYNFGLVRG